MAQAADPDALSRPKPRRPDSWSFGTVVVPALAWDELVKARPDAPGVDRLVAATWLVVDDRPLPEVDLGLDSGETAATLLTEALGGDLLLIDENNGKLA